MKIEMEHIEKTYKGKEVLRDISGSVDHGEIAALTGPSGAGKTTLLRLLLGLERPDSGTLRLMTSEGREVPLPAPGEGGRTPRRRDAVYTGCVFQEDRLLESFSAVQNILTLLPKRGSADETERKVRDALAELLPEDALDQPVSELSGGMRRRVCLARACLQPAEWLVLDEPFTGLDEENRERAVAFLLRHREGRTVIMATHSLDGISWDRILSLQKS